MNVIITLQILNPTMYMLIIIITFFCILIKPSSSSLSPPIYPHTTIEEYLKELQIPLENHYVTTSDGYILNIHRLPNPNATKTIFLQHGILASSWCWLSSSQYAPAVLLYRQGYEIFLGNNRGNIFSTNHTHFKTDSKEFWNFTFDDMAHYDLPAMLTYTSKFIRNEEKKMTYIAWSQGTTQFFILGSDNNNNLLKNNIDLFIALSPVAYVKSTKSLLLEAVSKFKLGKILEEYYPYGLFEFGPTLDTIETFLCKITFGFVCKIGVDSVCGIADNDSDAQVERLTTHFPAGTSAKDFNHYEQFMEKDPAFFGRYDYGEEGNMKEYGMKTPPIYNISSYFMNTGVKIAMFRGADDILVEESDYKLLREKLTDEVIVFENIYPQQSHVTWFVGKPGLKWLDDMMMVIKKESCNVRIS